MNTLPKLNLQDVEEANQDLCLQKNEDEIYYNDLKVIYGKLLQIDAIR